MKTRNALFPIYIYIFSGILPTKEQSHPHFPCFLNFIPSGLQDGHWCIVQMEKWRWETKSTYSTLGKARGSERGSVPAAHSDPPVLFGQAGACPARWGEPVSTPGVGHSPAAWPWTRPMVVWDLPHADVAMEVDLHAHGKSPCLEGMTLVQNGQKVSNIEFYGKGEHICTPTHATWLPIQPWEQVYPQGLLTREQASPRCCHLHPWIYPRLAGQDPETLNDCEGSPALSRRFGWRPPEVPSQLNYSATLSASGRWS